MTPLDLLETFVREFVRDLEEFIAPDEHDTLATLEADAMREWIRDRYQSAHATLRALAHAKATHRPIRRGPSGFPLHRQYNDQDANFWRSCRDCGTYSPPHPDIWSAYCSACAFTHFVHDTVGEGANVHT